jgi:hypothetical protein
MVMLLQGFSEVVEADTQRRQEVEQHEGAVAQGDGLNRTGRVERREAGKQAAHRSGQQQEANHRRRP